MTTKDQTAPADESPATDDTPVDPDEVLRINDPAAWLAAHDHRARVTIDKPVNIAQLDAELGGHGLCCDDATIVVAEDSPVTQHDLSVAYTNHVAVFPPTPAEQRAAIIDTAADWKTAMKQLADAGLLA